MNCTCINDLELKLAKKYSGELGADATAECQASGFTIGMSVSVIHKTDFKITADVPGFKRGKTVPVIASFCPFCGKSARESAAA